MKNFIIDESIKTYDLGGPTKMMHKIRNKSSIDVQEDYLLYKPKCQAILSLIAHFQHQNKNIQRAHLIQVLVKDPVSNSSQKKVITDDDKKIIMLKDGICDDGETVNKHDEDTSKKGGGINQKRGHREVTQNIMFNSIAHLDKTIQQLRKLGLITNQFMRGYPRIILTHKGRMVFYSVIYPTLLYQTIVELINKFHF